jgi:hypothetical protein
MVNCDRAATSRDLLASVLAFILRSPTAFQAALTPLILMHSLIAFVPFVINAIGV